MALEMFKIDSMKNPNHKSFSTALALSVCIGGLGLQQLYLRKYKSWLWRFGSGWLVIAVAAALTAYGAHVDFFVWFLALIWLFVNVVVDWLTMWRQVDKVNKNVDLGII
jgi:hypothetical protein